MEDCSALFGGGNYTHSVNEIMGLTVPENPKIEDWFMPYIFDEGIGEEHVEFFKWLVKIGVRIDRDCVWISSHLSRDSVNVRYMREILDVVGFPYYTKDLHDYRTTTSTFLPCEKKKAWKILTIEEFYTELFNYDVNNLGIYMGNYKHKSNPRHFNSLWCESWGVGYDRGVDAVLREGKKVWPVATGPIIKMDELVHCDSMGSMHQYSLDDDVDFVTFLWDHGPYDKIKSDLSGNLVKQDDPRDLVGEMFENCFILMK